MKNIVLFNWFPMKVTNGNCCCFLMKYVAECPVDLLDTVLSSAFRVANTV